MNNSSLGNNGESESSSHNLPTLSQDSAMSEQVPHNTPNGSLSLSTAESPLINEQMIAERQRRDLREELKCSICVDMFRQPVSLPACGHTFCRVCIETYLQHLSTPTQSKEVTTRGDKMAATCVHCPLCRKPSCITRAGSEWRLIENLIAANMVERVIEPSERLSSIEKSRATVVVVETTQPQPSFTAHIEPDVLAHANQLEKDKDRTAIILFSLGCVALCCFNPLGIIVFVLGVLIMWAFPSRIAASKACRIVVTIFGVLVILVGISGYIFLLVWASSHKVTANKQ